MIGPFQKLLALPRRHPRLAVPALVLALAAVGTLAVVLWARYHLHAAQRALERYALDEAQHHLDLYLQVHPGSAAAHLLAAQTARRRDAYSEAEQHLTACTKLGGMTEASALERLLLSAQQGNFSGVEGSLRARTGADDPEAIPVLEALAKGYMTCHWEAQALVCLNILLDREPRHPQALLMRARVWENRALKGEKDSDVEALHNYEKAMEVNPTFEVRLGLAGALFRVGQPWQAKLLYEQLRSLQPSDPEVMLGMARCLYSLHAADEADQLLKQLLEQYPDNATALLERGRIAMHAGRLTDAERFFRQAASHAPRYDVEALRLLCRCLEQAGSGEEEVQTCRNQVAQREAEVLNVERLTAQASRDPQNVALRFDIGMQLMRLGREQDGVAVLLFVLQQAPGYRPAHEVLAAHFERAGQRDRAARHRRASLLAGGNMPGR